MIFWKGILIFLMLPLAMAFHTYKLLAGKEKSIQFFYPKIVNICAKLLSMNIPTLKENEDFTIFSKNLKTALFKMPFEKIDVAVDEPGRIQLNITVCQFSDVFKLLGMTELTKALCDGDVVFCEKFQPCVAFERSQRIEKGDSHCDHTFVSKVS